MISKVKAKLKFLPEIILGLATVLLRLVNLGYSDYQGDEIKALFLPEPGQSVADFLLTQRKGPLQFLITFLLKFINPTYTNEFLMRLPFALAGIFAIFFFYKLVKLHFGRKIALFSSFFLSTNGFLIAFSRIVQYQSFVIFFMILSLYVFSLATLKSSWKIKGLYLGFIFWALSILFHYDGILIAPFAGYLIYKWVQEYKSDRRLVKHIFLALIVPAFMLGCFYIPFIFAISSATRAYWQNRISGGDGKISSSKHLFQVYHPIYVIHFYTLLAVLGTLFGSIKIVLDFVLAKIFKRLETFLQKFYVVTFVRKQFVSAELNYLSTIAVFIWVLVPLVFLECLVNVPGTHIYTYLIPLTIILGFGMCFGELLLKLVFGKLAFYLMLLGTTILFAFLFLQSYYVFVDHTAEYPWENEKFLIWEFHKPSAMFHLSMFGFPYFRHWEEIRAFVLTSENNGFYSTNERSSIARYYIPFQKDTDSSGHYIYIVNPQSFADQILSEKARYWVEIHSPVLTFFKEGREIAKVYYMPVGPLSKIMELEK